MRNSNDVGPGCGIFMLVIGIIGFAAWLNHIITCLQDGSWGFLIAGALFFPIGIIHGIGLWFGWF